MSLAHYLPRAAGWASGAAVPYAHIAAALDAASSTRSRLIKELVLTNAFRAVLALRAKPAEIEAMCYLLSPAKDAQSGGHRLRPDWSLDSRPLGLTHGAITASILEATGATKAEFSSAYAKVRDSGDAALACREGRGGGRQMLLLRPKPLAAGGVHSALLALADLSGTGVEKAKASRLAALLRAAVGTELKWLVRTFVPHMTCGISLEASVLPALAAAALHHAHDAVATSTIGAGTACARPSAESVRSMQDAMRSGYALRPDVRLLVAALIDGVGALPRDGTAPLVALSNSIAEVCTLTTGVPSQPMLAKPCTSIADALKMLTTGSATIGGKGAGASASGSASTPIVISAEHKYDGQRCQIHRSSDGSVRLFSRKLDDMTSKYPDVCAAVGHSARSARAFIADAEIVPMKIPSKMAPPPTDDAVNAADIADAAADAGAAPGAGADQSGAGQALGTFQSLSTRKRKNVTEANAASSSVPVCLFLFDLLVLGEEVYIERTLSERRAALRDEFAPMASKVDFAASVDVVVNPIGGATRAGTANSGGSEDGGEGGGGDATHAIEIALRRAVEEGCEGLMLKRLTCRYEPSWGTRRSDGWVKCKKDYIEGMGDSLDLVPIGGWRGQGRKKQWISPWLMATYDPKSGTFGSVCRVMSGFTDAFYKEHTIKYLGSEFSMGGAVADGEGEEAGGNEGAEGEDDDEEEGEDLDEMDEDGDSGGARTRRGPADGVETGEQPPYWFDPCEVWELRGADITVSPVHMAAAGLVHAQRGLSMRFPRFIRKRPDKRLADATTPEQLVEMFRKQTQGQGDA